METCAVACSYLRCSGESQISGDTWDRQKESIGKYASSNHIDIVREFRDEGITGKMELENRRGLSDCIQYVQENKINLVLVEDSTRLARDLIVSEVIMREFQKIGVRIVSASGGVDLTAGDDQNPTAKLVRQILSAVAEFDRCVVVLKLKGARQRMKQELGRCEGRKPFGALPGEPETLARMKELAVLRIPRDVAAALNQEGSRARSGRPWHPSTVAKILARQ